MAVFKGKIISSFLHNLAEHELLIRYSIFFYFSTWSYQQPTVLSLSLCLSLSPDRHPGRQAGRHSWASDPRLSPRRWASAGLKAPTGLGGPPLPAPVLTALFVFGNDFIIPSQQEPAFISISLVAWQTKRGCGGGTEPGRQAGRQAETEPSRHLSICVALSQRMGPPRFPLVRNERHICAVLENTLPALPRYRMLVLPPSSIATCTANRRREKKKNCIDLSAVQWSAKYRPLCEETKGFFTDEGIQNWMNEFWGFNWVTCVNFVPTSQHQHRLITLKKNA